MNDILHVYQKTNSDPKKKLLSMKDKEHPGLDYSQLFNDKDNKESQQIIWVCQWMIVSVIMCLSYSVY